MKILLLEQETVKKEAFMQALDEEGHQFLKTMKLYKDKFRAPEWIVPQHSPSNKMRYFKSSIVNYHGLNILQPLIDDFIVDHSDGSLNIRLTP